MGGGHVNVRMSSVTALAVYVQLQSIAPGVGLGILTKGTRHCIYCAVPTLHAMYTPKLTMLQAQNHA